MPYFYKVISGLTILWFFTSSLQAQNLTDGFTLGQGNTTIALSYSWESYDQFYFADEKRDAPAPYGGEISTQSISLFAAYGLTDKLDIIVNLPYIQAKGDGDDETLDQDVDNLQDVSLFLEWNPLSLETDGGKLSFVGALGLSTPLSDYEADAVLSIGNQSTRMDPKVLIQYQTKSGLFANLQAGYSLRSNDVPNATVLGAKVGFAAAKFYLDIWSESQYSDSDAPDITPGEVPFNETRVNYAQLGANAYYPISSLVGVSVGYGQYVSGRNVGLASRISGSLIFNL
ncbi:hypothetical protein PZB74_20905 [Porifericola rhodea]|uniref:transporter n=1 Tax=Porifericola rhodea TaxID=930972 RepID=UPI002666987A|nr:transporter [Porifericola rhodea]WKN31413.1 hypothetical protein PZB74_20905 [Porifericola rhodea]